MSAETLREAATAIRDEWGANGPTGGAWHRERDFHRAVAYWLDDTAAGWPWDGEDPEVVDWDGDRLTFSESMDSRALAVARAYLGESA